ncbi:ATP-binding cassette domain-containing protein [Thioclava sp. SK-1]|uniref:ATP-binding cassette domain-containing protein n=1 Tax=Thioclava sp. SK-1 TaxID=1889770 RepID=UPI0009F51C57|nr:ATP-binding cassette domain-containing protein [Thioclava sp. SK-1]
MRAPVTLRQTQLGWGDTHVLSNINLTISPGERIVFLGRSGAGKSTLLQSFIGCFTPNTISVVAQDHGLVGPLSAFHNTWMGQLDRHGTCHNLRVLLWPLRRERERAENYLNSVGLTGISKKKVQDLSGGQKQRVALARALMRGGDVVLADEPVSALDPSQGRNLLAALQTRFHTCILALHDVSQA